ncbi:MAG: tyrosine-protein phosphatase [Endomicrobia bacterium]|nr:tyrosine-protein phosphatase [Bacillota bacterium]MCL1972807.1 tyrosine-protein phosphatase [Endomicrobiia bacterium]
MKKVLFTLLFVIFFTQGYVVAQEQVEIKDETQAVPVQKEGLANFYKVSDILYRAEQPTSEGFKSLQNMGIKTVVNLRAHHSDEKKMKGLKMKYVQIPINTWSLSDKHVEQFLKVMADPDNYPVLVHCQHGADRTGAMVSVYRMVFENWSKEDAIAEMTGKNFGYHRIWKNLPEYIENFDIEKWKTYKNNYELRMTNYE